MKKIFIFTFLIIQTLFSSIIIASASKNLPDSSPPKLDYPPIVQPMPLPEPILNPNSCIRFI